MSEWTARLLVPILATGLGSLGCAMLPLGSQQTSQWSPWLSMSAAFVLGIAASVAAGYGWIVRPMILAARTCDRVAAGDLSETLREVGPPPLKAVARVFNTILADFQEVLLLFAYFLRSAKTSIQLLREQADAASGGNAVRSLCASTLDDLKHMQEMIEGFRYFRVRIESGTVTDAGVRPKEDLDGTCGGKPRAGGVRRAPDASVVKRKVFDHE
jgi:methyl-accepting chemotaxis protein